MTPQEGVLLVIGQMAAQIQQQGEQLAAAHAEINRLTAELERPA